MSYYPNDTEKIVDAINGLTNAIERASLASVTAMALQDKAGPSFIAPLLAAMTSIEPGDLWTVAEAVADGSKRS